jgi:hypothetical protein
MGNRTGGQRKGPFRLPLYSPSQYKQLGPEDDEGETHGCELRWGLNRILRLEETYGDKAAMGVERHDQLEAWSKFGIMPTAVEAKAAMRHAPAPRSAVSEAPVRFDMPNSYWIGYVDLAYDWRLDTGPLSPPQQPEPPEDEKRTVYLKAFGKPAGRPAPLATTGITVIHDWKFTSSWDYALTTEELYDDFAANLYAKDAFEGGATRVFCRWVYTLWDSKSPREVWAEMSYEHVMVLMNRADRRAAYANEVRRKVAAGEMSVYDLPIDTSYCFSFNKVCPRKGNQCNPVRESRKIIPRRKEDMDSFEQETAANFPTTAAGKTLPPLPGKKPLPPLPGKALPPLPPKPAAAPVEGKKLPPLPPKKAGADPKAVASIESKFKGLFTPEAGFVNPVGGPTVAAASPEEAVAAGNVHVPEKVAEPEPDDLEGKPLAELRDIAKAIGATHAPKAKTAGVTAAIRARRAEMELNGETQLQAEANTDQAHAYEEMHAAQRELDAALQADAGGADGAAEAVESAERKLERLQENGKAMGAHLGLDVALAGTLEDFGLTRGKHELEGEYAQAALLDALHLVGIELKALANACKAQITLTFGPDTK